MYHHTPYMPPCQKHPAPPTTWIIPPLQTQLHPSNVIPSIQSNPILKYMPYPPAWPHSQQHNSFNEKRPRANHTASSTNDNTPRTQTSIRSDLPYPPYPKTLNPQSSSRSTSKTFDSISNKYFATFAVFFFFIDWLIDRQFKCHKTKCRDVLPLCR